MSNRPKPEETAGDQDQPHPTYFGPCPKCGILLGFGHLPEQCTGEAQGEAPQHSTGTILGHAIQYLNDQSPKNWEAVEIINKAWGEGLREYVYGKKQARVEAGAHPSQDARTRPYEIGLAERLADMTHAAEYLHQSAALGEDVFRQAVQDVAKVWAGARSTPSLPSDTWEVINRERGRLIDLLIAGKASALEIACADALNQYADAHVKLVAPRPEPPNCDAAPSPDPPPTLQQEHASLQQSYIHVFERAETAEDELARQKTTYLGLLDEAGKEVRAREAEIGRLREAFRAISESRSVPDRIIDIARKVLAAPDPKGE